VSSARNILEAYGWALDKRNLNRLDALSEPYVRQPHLRVFDQSGKGLAHTEKERSALAFLTIRSVTALATLLEDARYWLEYQTYEPDEIGVRFHRRMI
jgi:hypothetical protein